MSLNQIKEFAKRLRVIPFLIVNDSAGSTQLQIDYNRQKCLRYYYKHKDEAVEYQKELKYLKDNYPICMQCRDFSSFQRNIPREKIEAIRWDEHYSRYYCDFYGKKMYYPQGFKKQTCITYYLTYLYEQEYDSPHRYLSDVFCVNKGDVLFDVGAAEGFFTLQHLDTISEAFVFECDDTWIDALNITFEGMDKVHIISKYVDSETSDSTVKLNDYLSVIEGRSVFVKMDIEGAEKNALIGMNQLISDIEDIRCAICAYHKRDDYKELPEYLNGMKYEYSDGYMLCLDGYQKPPYFRHGMIRAHKEV